MTDFEIVMTVITVVLGVYILWDEFTTKKHKN